VDIGLNTLAAVTSNQRGRTPFLVNGRPLQAINQWYNKRRARLQTKRPQGVCASRARDMLTDKRDRQITDYLQVASRRLVDHLVAPRPGTLIVGKNDGRKQASGLGKRTKQTGVVVPHARFIALLRDKAELVGIRVVVSEESDPSKCSFLDLDPVGKREGYAGKRVKRGLFQAADGRRLNADSNGAYTILRKGVPNAFGNGRGGVVVHPVRMTLAHGPHGSNVHVA
jgi:transposase